MSRRPTHTEALDYVQAKEESWGIKSGVQLGRADNHDDPRTGEVLMVRVRPYASANDWLVWVEDDGTIYGEC